MQISRNVVRDIVQAGSKPLACGARVEAMAPPARGARKQRALDQALGIDHRVVLLTSEQAAQCADLRPC